MRRASLLLPSGEFEDKNPVYKDHKLQCNFVHLSELSAGDEIISLCCTLFNGNLSLVVDVPVVDCKDSHDPTNIGVCLSRFAKRSIAFVRACS